MIQSVFHLAFPVDDFVQARALYGEATVQGRAPPT